MGVLSCGLCCRLKHKNNISHRKAPFLPRPIPGKLGPIKLKVPPDQAHRGDRAHWEFYERGGKQAVRAGQWKAVRMPMFTGQTELYDLTTDVGETNNVAADHPDVVKRLEAMMADAHTPHANWEVRGSR